MEDIDTRLALETYAERYGEFGLPQRDDSYAILCSLCLAPESFTEPLGVTLRKLVSRDIGLRAFLAVMAANRGLDAAVAHATPEHDLIARLGEPYVLQRFAALESVSQLFTPEVVGLPEAHTLKMKALYAALLDACALGPCGFLTLRSLRSRRKCLTASCGVWQRGSATGINLPLRVRGRTAFALRRQTTRPT
jgi:hypothetical protein